MRTKIAYILIGAAKRRGKDTFANYLQELNAERKDPRIVTKRYSFAESLRAEVQLALQNAGAPYDVHTEDPELKEKVIRPLLIAWGQMRRHQDPDYWIKKLIEEVNNDSFEFIWTATVPNPEWFVAIVSDWRFPNEYTKVLGLPKDESAEVFAVHIDRPGVPYAGPDEEKNDPICRSFAPYGVQNTGDLSHLRTQAYDLLNAHVIPFLLDL